MKTTIGYIRVSTKEQGREGVSLDMQEERIKSYCDTHGLELVRIIRDAGISAKSITTRPNFKAAISSVLNGEADSLCLWKIDRGFRNTVDAILTESELKKKKRSLVSVCEDINTSTALGEFSFSLWSSLATMERKQIGERTRAALQLKKSRSERVGQIPFGFRLTADGYKLEKDEGEQFIIRHIHEYHFQGLSFNAIAKKLNADGIKTKDNKCWCHPQVSRILRMGV